MGGPKNYPEPLAELFRAAKAVGAPFTPFERAMALTSWENGVAKAHGQMRIPGAGRAGTERAYFTGRQLERLAATEPQFKNVDPGERFFGALALTGSVTRACAVSNIEAWKGTRMAEAAGWVYIAEARRWEKPTPETTREDDDLDPDTMAERGG